MKILEHFKTWKSPKCPWRQRNKKYVQPSMHRNKGRHFGYQYPSFKTSALSDPKSTEQHSVRGNNKWSDPVSRHRDFVPGSPGDRFQNGQPGTPRIRQRGDRKGWKLNLYAISRSSAFSQGPEGTKTFLSRTGNWFRCSYFVAAPSLKLLYDDVFSFPSPRAPCQYASDANRPRFLDYFATLNGGRRWGRNRGETIER